VKIYGQAITGGPWEQHHTWTPSPNAPRARRRRAGRALSEAGIRRCTKCGAWTMRGQCSTPHGARDLGLGCAENGQGPAW
jgi:ribosomal protein L32